MTTFDDVLTWSGTSLYDAGDALKAVANKYEDVYEELTGLSTDGLEDKTAGAEAKARRILADDAMDLWTALGHSGNDLIDASTTVDSLMNQAWGIKARAEARGLTITNGTVEVSESDQAQKVDKDVRANLRLLLPSYQEEVDRLMEQVEGTVVLLQGVYDDIAGLDDTALGPRAAGRRGQRWEAGAGPLLDARRGQRLVDGPESRVRHPAPEAEGHSRAVRHVQ